MAQHRNIQYERAVPKFLQAYIKQHVPASAADDSDGDSGDEQQRSAKAAARRKLEDRPDRDDEAPVVVGGDEYVSEIRHGLVEGIAAKQVLGAIFEFCFWLRCLLGSAFRLPRG
jgi:hypothetical protein